MLTPCARLIFDYLAENAPSLHQSPALDIINRSFAISQSHLLFADLFVVGVVLMAPTNGTPPNLFTLFLAVDSSDDDVPLSPPRAVSKVKGIALV